MDKLKSSNFKKELDNFVEQEDNLKKEDLFMGMTDEEILVNKNEW